MSTRRAFVAGLTCTLTMPAAAAFADARKSRRRRREAGSRRPDRSHGAPSRRPMEGACRPRQRLYLIQPRPAGRA
jgi:hypothetical protein